MSKKAKPPAVATPAEARESESGDELRRRRQKWLDSSRIGGERNSPVDYENLNEIDHDRFVQDHAHRLGNQEATLRRVIDLGSVRSSLDSRDLQDHHAIAHTLGDVRLQIRDAVYRLHDACVGLEGRFHLPYMELGDPPPPSYTAFGWVVGILHEILTRASYAFTLTFEPDGRSIHRYLPPKGPSLNELLERIPIGPDSQAAVGAAKTEVRREGELAIKDDELGVFQVALSLLEADRGPQPPLALPDRPPTQDEVFPIGWPEEDFEKARALLRLGRDWKSAVLRHGPVSKQATRSHSEFAGAGDYFAGFIHAYFELPRVDPGSPFAVEAERLYAVLLAMDEAAGFTSASRLYRRMPTEETWIALDKLDGAVAELNAAVIAYRSQAYAFPVEGKSDPTIPINDCERWIVSRLRESMERMTQATLLEVADKAHGKTTIREGASRLVQVGALVSIRRDPGDGKGIGYGLPEWS